ncbi:MAG: leucine-rich repeat domain-containing protein [Spirochaetaceae bacterium]|jgi:hypothetical protein|nr:leucine-rich repeat domain-containing protein [Spirochaetaceae bacterium]
MKKLIFSLLVLSGCITAAFGQSGTLKAMLNPDKTVTITGITGTMTVVDIPEQINDMPVVSIDPGAFADKGLIAVTLPSTLKKIGSQAFKGNKLTEIVIPDSVTYIGYGAFEGNKIKELTIPSNTKAIRESVFAWNSITKLSLPQSLVAIGANAFQGNKMTSVEIPASVAFIGGNAFISTPLSVIKIGSNVYTGTYAYSTYNESFSNKFDYFYFENPRAGTYTYDAKTKEWSYKE